MTNFLLHTKLIKKFNFVASLTGKNKITPDCNMSQWLLIALLRYFENCLHLSICMGMSYDIYILISFSFHP